MGIGQGNARSEVKMEAYQLCRLSESLHDNVWADTLFDIAPDLFQQLSSKQNHARRSISDLSILGTCDVDQGPGGGVNDVEKLEDGGTVVCNLSLAAVVDDKLVHTPWTESASECLCNGKACGDV